MLMNQFKVIVPSYDSPQYLKKCLESLEKQTYKNFQAIIIDDNSTIPEQRDIILQFCQKNGWDHRFHAKNYGALNGIVNALKDANPDDNDVIVILDGDDWFAHPNVLQKLHSYYNEYDIYLTWGQCEKFPTEHPSHKFAQPISTNVINQKLYRQIPYVFWHPRTFKYILWRNIQDSDLRDVNGEYFHILYDKAIFFPMLEMAGQKVLFIPETLYIFNMENPLNDFQNAPRGEWERVNHLLKSKPIYQTLDICSS